MWIYALNCFHPKEVELLAFLLTFSSPSLSLSLDLASA
jgi:hypothetical protein